MDASLMLVPARSLANHMCSDLLGPKRRFGCGNGTPGKIKREPARLAFGRRFPLYNSLVFRFQINLPDHENVYER